MLNNCYVMVQLTPPKTSIGIGSSVSYLLNIGVLANSEIELRLGGWASQTPGYGEALYDHNNIICMCIVGSNCTNK